MYYRNTFNSLQINTGKVYAAVVDNNTEIIHL